MLKVGDKVKFRDSRVGEVAEVRDSYVRFKRDRVWYKYDSKLKSAPTMWTGPNSNFDIIEVLCK